MSFRLNSATRPRRLTGGLENAAELFEMMDPVRGRRSCILLLATATWVAAAAPVAAEPDTNADGYVDIFDASLVATCSLLGASSDPHCVYADVDEDGRVDATDLAPIEANYGQILFDPIWPAFTPTSGHRTRDGVLHFYLPGQDRIQRWSVATRRSLAPVDFEADSRHVAYSAETDVLYVSYPNGRITQLDASFPVAEVPFAQVTGEVAGLATAGRIVLAVGPGVFGSAHYTFTPDGVPADSLERAYASPEYVWSEANRRLYLISTGSPRDLLWEAIDPGTGDFLGDGDSPHHGAYSIQPPIRVSRDGAQILLGSGDLYDGATTAVFRSFPFSPTDAEWLEDGTLLTLTSHEGDTLLRHWTPALSLINLELFEGEPLRVFGGEAGVAVATSIAGRPGVHPYFATDDGDGDGVPNDEDAFPLDPAASRDSDSDGAPDDWNPGYGPDDSTTGLVLDAFPLDSACQLPEHALPSAPGVCDVQGRVPAFTQSGTEADDSGIIYLLDTDTDRVYRWSLEQDAYLNPIPVAEGPQHIAVSSANDRLYVGYESGEIRQVDLSDPALRERAFSATSERIVGLEAAGTFLFAAAGRSWYSHSTFAADGTRISLSSGSLGLALTWSEANERVYSFRTGSPSDIVWQRVDPATGEITGSAESPYHGDFGIQRPIRVSRDGARVLLGTGDYYHGLSLEIEGSLPISPAEALWLEDGRLLTLRFTGFSSSVLEEWSPDLSLQSARNYLGAPVRLLETLGETTVVTRANGAYVFEEYVLTEDSDGDGVSNDVDAFPQDPAASVDSDNDGHPDDWNPGYGPEDSTTGLVIDAFPLDSACYLAEHALPGQPDVCDIAGSIAPYDPTRIEVGEAGVVYLLSAENGRVYRWSLESDDHLNPIVVDDRPDQIAYSADNGRLYTAYDSGLIRQIDPADSALREQAFGITLNGVRGLEAAGRFVYTIDSSGGGSAHYSFAADGTQLDRVELFFTSGAPSWSAGSDRLYFFEYTSLRFAQIDPTTGQLTPGSPRVGTLTLPPIRPSRDGSRVVVGGGLVHDGTTLERIASLPDLIQDALWLDDGRLVTIRDAGDGSSILEQWSADLVLHNVETRAGSPLRLLASLGEIAVVTRLAGLPIFSEYVPSDDGDGDGVPNDEDAFPLDPAASIDSDGDGYPDAWNPGMGPEDSTLGLVIDAFPFEEACQLPEHALPGQADVCDIANGIPDYVPARITADGSGILYLLSPENDRLYRWSLAQDYHLDPLDVGESPQQLAYSAENDRLYIAYDTGEIHQIDPADPGLLEQPFAATTGRTTGLQTAGPFVFAIDASDNVTHSTFAPDGTEISAVRSSRFSRELTFSAANERMYFFRDNVGPNDIHWEQIDPVTGALGAVLESPYHSAYLILPPIRVSPDGARVVLGSGDFYDALTLEYIESLPIDFAEALWLADGTLLTARDPGDGTTLLEHWNADLSLVDEVVYPGAPLRVIQGPGEVVVVTQLEGQPAFSEYVASNDGDGDGVPHDADDFPLDPAASIDTDGDGHPDAWNPGKGPEDSLTGLVLDDHMNPIVVEDAPLYVAHSADNGRLYTAYDTGAIRELDIAQAFPKERHFATTADRPWSIQTAGPFVFVSDSSGLGETHHTFATDGAHISSVDLNERAHQPAWSAVNDRMYFFEDSSSPDTIQWERVDLVTGEISDEGETISSTASRADALR